MDSLESQVDLKVQLMERIEQAEIRTMQQEIRTKQLELKYVQLLRYNAHLRFCNAHKVPSFLAAYLQQKGSYPEVLLMDTTTMGVQQWTP